MPTSIRIRPAVPADAPNLAVLGTQVWLHTYATDGIRDSISRYVLETFTLERLAATIADDQKSVLVAEAAEHAVGYLVLDFGAERPESVPIEATELATLYVQEHFVRRGVGAQLLARAADVARQRTGSCALWLSVYHRNTNAIAFYMALGFGRCGTIHFDLEGEQHLNYVLVRT